MTAPRTPITAVEAAGLDPHNVAPPIIVTDGERTEIGAAHGRVLPLVGNKRPYIYDVSLPARRRIYADTPEDVIAEIIGGDYAALQAHLRGLEDVGGRDEVDEAWLALITLRHQHADSMRLSMQARINDEGHKDGRWDRLDEAEKDQLRKAADADGPFPTGILTETPIVDDDGEPKVAWVGHWYAAVPLVLNSGDYAPYSDTPIPQSTYIDDTTGPDDEHNHVVPGDPNLVVLDITDNVSYLSSLEEAGWLTVSVMPAEQPDKHFRDLSVDSDAL